MPRAAQLNIRMNPKLKEAGDSVLELYGISPTELIRALWQKISLGEAALAQVVHILAAEPSAGSARRQLETGGASIASAVLQRQAAFEQELGLDSSTYAPMDDEALEDLVYEDWLQGRETDHAL